MSAAMETALQFQQQLEANREQLSRNQLKKQRRKMKEMFAKAADPAGSQLPTKKCSRPGKRGRAARAAAKRDPVSTEDSSAPRQPGPHANSKNKGTPTHHCTDTTADASNTTHIADDKVLTQVKAAKSSKKRRRHDAALADANESGTVKGRVEGLVEGRVEGKVHEKSSAVTAATVSAADREAGAATDKPKKKTKHHDTDVSHPSSKASGIAADAGQSDQDGRRITKTVKSHSKAGSQHSEQPGSSSNKRAKLTIDDPAQDGNEASECVSSPNHKKTSKKARKHAERGTAVAEATPVAEQQPASAASASQQLPASDAAASQQLPASAASASQQLPASASVAAETHAGTDAATVNGREDKVHPAARVGKPPAVPKVFHFVPRSCLVSKAASKPSAQGSLPNSSSSASLKSNSDQPCSTQAPLPDTTSSQQLLQRSKQAQVSGSSVAEGTNLRLPSASNLSLPASTNVLLPSSSNVKANPTGETTKDVSASTITVAGGATLPAALSSCRCETPSGAGAPGPGHTVHEQERDAGRADDVDVDDDKTGDPQGASTSGREDAGQQGGLSKKNSRPAYVYGNYHRYYGYRLAGAVHQDPRLKVFEAEWFQGKACIDVGCNSGLVTLDVATHFKCKSMLGVDIDAGLVAKACRHLSQLRSKLTAQLTGPRHKVQWTPGTTMSDLRSQVEALSNTAFVHEEWVSSPGKKRSADAVLCLSVTKWIHFHTGDEGIKQLFAKVAKVLTPGGVFVLEPQPWSSYVKTRKKPQMLTVPYQDISKLQLRPEGFVEYLTTTHGMTLIKEVQPGDDAGSGFDRTIYVLKKS